LGMFPYYHTAAHMTMLDHFSWGDGSDSVWDIVSLPFFQEKKEWAKSNLYKWKQSKMANQLLVLGPVGRVRRPCCWRGRCPAALEFFYPHFYTAFWGNPDFILTTRPRFS
jgi:hypothetical protein